MEKGNWSEIKVQLHNTLKEIFCNYDFHKLNDYEKRKIIFEYLCNNISYDYELFNNIKNFHEGKGPVARNSLLELSNVINNKVGICNAISQYYKFLLEEVGISAYCVICDDGTLVKHQLNLVYDEENKTYSFDDVTSVIVGRGNIEDYFDYNLEKANFFNQGNVEVTKGKLWFILPEDYINYFVGRENTFVKTLEKMPNNIVSVKPRSGTSRF